MSKSGIFSQEKNIESCQYIYTPEIIRGLLNLLPSLEAVKERGTLLLHPGAYRINIIDEKVISDQLEEMCPAPSRRRNRPYRIDDVGAIMVDLHTGLDSLPKGQKNRLILYYLHGYDYREIAEMENRNDATLFSNEESVKKACNRSIERIAEYLETARPKHDPKLPEREETHKRKYASFPRYSFEFCK